MSKSMKNARADQKDIIDELMELDMRGLPYVPPSQMSSGSIVGPQGTNPVVFLELATVGGRRLPSGQVSAPTTLGRLYFELRRDLLPVTCTNFLSLCTGLCGFGEDGVMYSLKVIFFLHIAVTFLRSINKLFCRERRFIVSLRTFSSNLAI